MDTRAWGRKQGSLAVERESERLLEEAETPGRGSGYALVRQERLWDGHSGGEEQSAAS